MVDLCYFRKDPNLNTSMKPTTPGQLEMAEYMVLMILLIGTDSRVPLWNIYIKRLPAENHHIAGHCFKIALRKRQLSSLGLIVVALRGRFDAYSCCFEELVEECGIGLMVDASVHDYSRCRSGPV